MGGIGSKEESVFSTEDNLKSWPFSKSTPFLDVFPLCYNTLQTWKGYLLEQGWANSGPRATCEPLQRFQWPAEVFRKSFKSEKSSHSSQLTYIHTACLLCVFWAHVSDFETPRPFRLVARWEAHPRKIFAPLEKYFGHCLKAFDIV